MTDEEMLQLADDAATDIINNITANSALPLHTLVRDSVLRGMLIGQRMSLSIAASHLVAIKAVNAARKG